MNRRPTKRDLAVIVGDMGRLRGAIKSEAESFMAVNSSGTPCVSVREKTANDLLRSLATWQEALGALLEDDAPIEVS